MGYKAIFLVIALVVFFFLMTVWALVDVSGKRFATGGEKAVWWLIALIPFLGWVVYLIIGFRRGVKMIDG